MEEKRLCIACQEFLPLHAFKRGIRRSLCREHYNIRHRESQRQKSKENPRRLQSSTVWQMAFIDARKIFKTGMEMKPSEVRDLLQSCRIDSKCGARLVPADPCRPLSMQNFCLTSAENRREMCHAWKTLSSKPIYSKFLSPELGRLVYRKSELNEID